jgi:hypothetical protein
MTMILMKVEHTVARPGSEDPGSALQDARLVV